MLACQNGHTQIVELLLKEQVDPNIQTNDQFTSLIIACSAQIDNIEIVRLLLQYGADPNAKIDKTGTTPLLLAVNFGRSEILTELINVGANVSETFSMPPKPFINAIIRVPISGNCEVICNLSTGDVTFINSTGSSSVLYNLKQLKLTLIQCAVGMVALNEGKEKFLQSMKQGIMNIGKISQFGMEIDSKEIIEVLSQVSIDKRLEVLKVLSLRCPDNDSYTLMLAAMWGLTQVVDLLLEAGYDPQKPLSSSKTFEQFTKTFHQVAELDFTYPSLVAACSEGHLEVVKLLLRKTHDINHQQETGETFLMLACDCGHKDIVLTLLENGADPNICDNKGNSALHYVLLSNSSGDNILDIIQTLLSWNINVNAQNNNGMTPLLTACSKGYTEAILLLLLDKADPNITDNKGKTALMYTCENGHSEIVEHLLRTYETDPLQKSNNGISALSYAAYSGSIEVINILLHKHNPDQEEIEKAVTAACYGGHKESIKLLADKINLTNLKKDILTACVSDDMTLFVQVIAKQASFDFLYTPLIESTGLTPLMIAASCGSDRVVQTLLQRYGADVNQQDKLLNYSPLMYAVSGSKSTSTVQYLLDNYANVNVISKNKKTPLDIAKSKEIAQLLKKMGGKTYSSLMAVPGTEDRALLNTQERFTIIKFMSPMI
ncbi:PREDICTED: ankyrin-1-like [Amphimedon queenslandica]|uniref:Ankyrin repeat protein n=1 Tax=Amphimedon queenslandica TaxID=400682 RepID=A0AAN0JKT3_AMPQE|nr:PREDICTED: ankyrin-1-like [Amphimedon queenslandica]|eukprot:XP_019857637.1 PREDICTED: ankyrin-1-like [Amphimedon queenslandica]